MHACDSRDAWSMDQEFMMHAHMGPRARGVHEECMPRCTCLRGCQCSSLELLATLPGTFWTGGRADGAHAHTCKRRCTALKALTCGGSWPLQARSCAWEESVQQQQHEACAAPCTNTRSAAHLGEELVDVALVGLQVQVVCKGSAGGALHLPQFLRSHTKGKPQLRSALHAEGVAAERSTCSQRRSISGVAPFLPRGRLGLLVVYVHACSNKRVALTVITMETGLHALALLL